MLTHPPFVDDPRAPLGSIWLGSGTGVVAEVDTTCSRSGRRGGVVITTDLPGVCPLLQHSLGINA
ncbi:hypothetical protein J3R83DRAFT_683 [Lanmaoa asiatica]|nr:hypothetical protein J3R83DRAFT_683 [Lanmaoa asiatica]